MDLHTITDVIHRPCAPGHQWRPGDAWLAGGTWLFSTPQSDLRRLIDLTTLGWEPLIVTDDGLEIGATCTIRELHGFTPPAAWTAGPLLAVSCEAFLSSFKVWNAATVGGNICMSLPAGPMISMSVALQAAYTVWAPDGSERVVDAADFVTGDHENILQAGEILRRVNVPVTALLKQYAVRRMSLTRLGRSTAFLIGTRCRRTDEFWLTVTAATTRPVRLRFETPPDAASLGRELDEAIPDDLYFDDPNGKPDHRRHLTAYFAEQIRVELAGLSNGGVSA
jgi:CO/xanthine dehydrogenase FAD-binding subunit